MQNCLNFRLKQLRVCVLLLLLLLLDGFCFRSVGRRIHNMEIVSVIFSVSFRSQQCLNINSGLLLLVLLLCGNNVQHLVHIIYTNE